MSVVIDASVALKWVFDEPDSAAAVALRNEELIAPTLWLAEAANALWRRAQRGEITASEAVEWFADLRNAPVASLPIEPHLEPALKLAIEIGHPIYDCLYLALALRHQTHVMTADRRFASAAASRPHLSGTVRLLTRDMQTGGQGNAHPAFAASAAPAAVSSSQKTRIRQRNL
ncbi:MAG TPA: type II toxin-antitoxin system VapC family toxin [Stellaceae bacterium]